MKKQSDDYQVPYELETEKEFGPVIALIDGDIVSFRCAAATEERTLQVTHLPSKRIKTYKNKTEFKANVDLEKFPLTDFKLEELRTQQPIENTLYSVKHMIQAISDQVGAMHTKVFISGEDNFRHTLALPQPYKGNRAQLVKPTNLPEVHKYLIKHFNAKVCKGEADDDLRMEQYKYRTSQTRVVVCSTDKDAMGGDVGDLIYNWDTMKRPFEIKDLGGLWIEGKDTTKKVKGYGLHWKAVQWLAGDAVDGVKPTWLAGIPYGDKTAYATIKDLKTEDEIYAAVLQQYKAWYPKVVEYRDQTGQLQQRNYIGMAQVYHDAIHMKRFEKDWVDIGAIAQRLGFDNA